MANTQAKKTTAARIDVHAVIREAVAEGMKAGRAQAERAPVDAYKATERRLYAYPVLKERLSENRERLEELETNGTPGRSQSLVRYSRSGRRVSPEEMLEEMIRDLRGEIAKDELEIAAIDAALKTIKKDAYYQTVVGKFIEKRDDDIIAIEIPCDPTTVRRNRGRLMRSLAVRLYGAAAI